MEDQKSAYICPICGATLETCKHWGPICRRLGHRVCATCCYQCEQHVTFSGIWSCGYESEEDRRAARQKRAQERFEAENRKISEAYYRKRREERRQWAIKQAKARKKKQKANASGQ